MRNKNDQIEKQISSEMGIYTLRKF